MNFVHRFQISKKSDRLHFPLTLGKSRENEKRTTSLRRLIVYRLVILRFELR